MKIKIKNIIIVLIIALSVSFASYYYINGFVKYVPLTWEDGSGFFEIPAINTKEHQKNVILVLGFGGHPWRINHNQLFIQRKLYFDPELVWNITERAKSKEVIDSLKKLKKDYPDYFERKNK